MDNERPIEKLLRDYAKKRRTDAGEPEMHPATRRMLQGEVSRQFPNAKRGGWAFWELLARSRSRFVYGTCVLSVVAISVAVLLPSFRKGSPARQLAKVRSEEELADKKLLEPTRSAAPAVRETDEKLSTRGIESSNERSQDALTVANVVAKDDTQGLRRDVEKEKSEAARPPTQVSSIRSAPAALPPAPQITSLDQSAKRAVEAQGRLEPAAQDSPRRVAEQPPASGGAIPLAARSPSGTPAPTVAPTLASPEVDAVRQRYGIPATASAAVAQNSQTANSARYRRSTSLGADASSVLTTFQFEQAGDQLRVIDQDGSTYSGTISSSTTGVYSETKLGLKSGPVNKASNAPDAGKLSTVAADNYQAGQNYFFRVTGTNRTLKQPVVFAGNLLILSNAVVGGQASLQQSSAGRSQSQPFPNQNQLPGLLNSTLSGKVQLGTNREMQINAVPVSQ